MLHISQIKFSYNHSKHPSLSSNQTLPTYRTLVVKHEYNYVEYAVLSIAANVPILSAHDVDDCDVRQAKRKKMWTMCAVTDECTHLTTVANVSLDEKRKKKKVISHAEFHIEYRKCTTFLNKLSDLQFRHLLYEHVDRINNIAIDMNYPMSCDIHHLPIYSILPDISS